MKVSNINKNLSRCGLGLYELIVNKRTYKGYEYTLYREFFKNKLDLSVLMFKDKLNKHSGFRLKHISNGRITRKLDNFI